MSRTDKANEPSMEDILASIRQIISDEERDPGTVAGVVESDDGPNRGINAERAPHSREPDKKSRPAAQQTDDVFDLTDDLMLTDTSEEDNRPELSVSPAAYGETAAPSAAPPPPPRSGARTSLLSAAKSYSNHATPDSSVRVSQSREAPSAVQPSRPVWSRRELPPSPGASAPFAAGSPSFSRSPMAPETAPPPSQLSGAALESSSGGWRGDVFMPIPEDGPIALFNHEGANAGHPRDAELRQDMGNKRNDTRIERQESADLQIPPRLGAPSPSDEEIAVSQFAQTLAKSAIGSLDDEELNHARNVDFSSIDGEHKADVADKFANIIHERSARGANEPFLQSALLDEMLRQDFGRDQEQHAAFGRRGNETDTPVSSPSLRDIANAKETKQQPAAASPVPHPSDLRDLLRPRTPPSSNSEPDFQAVMASPVAQAQFMGASSVTAVSNAGRSLEDSVRDMLRPLLVQWLNDNMPRILEDAIREEIRTRGLTPDRTA